MAYVIVARWESRDGETGAIEELLRELVSRTREEPGVLQFVAHRSQDNPNEFLLYEQYASEQAFREHQQTDHFKTLVLERAVPLLAHRERLAYSIFD